MFSGLFAYLQSTLTLSYLNNVNGVTTTLNTQNLGLTGLNTALLKELTVVNFFATSSIEGVKALFTNTLTFSPFASFTPLSLGNYLNSVLDISYVQTFGASALTNVKSTESNKLSYTTNSLLNQDQNTAQQFEAQEIASDYRNLRLQNPIFKYDFKLGNYMPDDNKRKFSHLLTSIHDLTTGVKKPN